MDAWPSAYEQIRTTLDSLGSDKLLFRGHCETDWPLMPGLGRLNWSSGDDLPTTEQNLYFEFVTRAGELLPVTGDSWRHLFSMQHYGLPTRLLDWTETFGVALYFALQSGTGDAAIWILDPYELNRVTLNRAEIIHPHELHGSYDDYYISRVKRLEGNVVAIWPLRHNPRVFHQRAGFTLHDDLTRPLEALHGAAALKKIVIPSAARSGAARFLQLSGISEFSLFPDLDGLARELRREFFPISDAGAATPPTTSNTSLDVVPPSSPKP